MSPRGPFLFRTDSLSNLLLAWARLGPLSLIRIFRPVSDRRLIATVSAATAHPMGWLSGFPTGRPWDLASENDLHHSPWEVRKLPIPGPVPRIERPSPAVTSRLALPWVRRLAERRSLTSRRFASRAATLTRIVSRAFYSPLVSGGLWQRPHR